MNNGDVFRDIDEKLKNSDFKDGGRKNVGQFFVDKLVLNGFCGVFIFCFVLFGFFSLSFFCGYNVSKFIEFVVDNISVFFSRILFDCFLKDFFCKCVLECVSSVLGCAVQIFFFHFFLSLIEESGYLARGVFLIDKIMRKVGLCGEALMPLVSSFGCNVPAILATRTMPCKRDRIITAFVATMMSCTSKLPIYMLFSSIFFKGFWQVFFIFGVYLLGVFVGCVCSKIISLFVKKEKTFFIVEIPDYRIPDFVCVFKSSFSRMKHFIVKSGVIIFFFSFFVWILKYFPRGIEGMSCREQVEQSYIGVLGKKIEPLLSPLGFDWRMCVALFAGVGAKESIPSVLSVVYDEGDGIGCGICNFPCMVSFIVFVLFYCPCFGTLAVIKSEFGMSYSLLCLFFNTSLAYIISFLFFRFFLFFCT